MPKLTSIILTSFNSTHYSTHMTMESIATVTAYTDPEDYELILLDPVPKFPVRDDYKVLKIDKWLKPDPDPGYTACMNLGAKEAKGDYLVFMQNDVFVMEGWLEGLRKYIEFGYEVVYPDQVPRDRDYIKETYKRNWFDPKTLKGGRDAGLFMITKKAFERTGGWNEELGMLAERDFYQRMGNAGVNWTDTNKVRIIHIMAATNLQLLDENPDEYNAKMKKDADILNI